LIDYGTSLPRLSSPRILTIKGEIIHVSSIFVDNYWKANNQMAIEASYFC